MRRCVIGQKEGAKTIATLGLAVLIQLLPTMHKAPGSVPNTIPNCLWWLTLETSALGRWR